MTPHAFGNLGADAEALAHLDEVVTQLCLLAETSTSIILKTVLENRVMLPPVKASAA